LIATIAISTNIEWFCRWYYRQVRLKPLNILSFKAIFGETVPHGCWVVLRPGNWLPHPCDREFPVGDGLPH
jgi:hypothetical protein